MLIQQFMTFPVLFLFLSSSFFFFLTKLYTFIWNSFNAVILTNNLHTICSPFEKYWHNHHSQRKQINPSHNFLFLLQFHLPTPSLLLPGRSQLGNHFYMTCNEYSLCTVCKMESYIFALARYIHRKYIHVNWTTLWSVSNINWL